MKKLPNISFHGTKDELIKIEPILVLIGYDVPDEKWNNHCIVDLPVISWLCCAPNHHKSLEYHSHSAGPIKEFKAKHVDKAIDYLIKEGCLK